MSKDFDAVFARLRAILEPHAAGLTVAENSPRRYCLEGVVGPATVKARGGSTRTGQIQVAWVQIEKSYVSYHMMAFGHEAIQGAMSDALKAHMQGKTCLNFKTADEALFKELEHITRRGIDGFRKAGYIA